MALKLSGSASQQRAQVLAAARKQQASGATRVTVGGKTRTEVKVRTSKGVKVESRITPNTKSIAGASRTKALATTSKATASKTAQNVTITRSEFHAGRRKGESASAAMKRLTAEKHARMVGTRTTIKPTIEKASPAAIVAAAPVIAGGAGGAAAGGGGTAASLAGIISTGIGIAGAISEFAEVFEGQGAGGGAPGGGGPSPTSLSGGGRSLASMAIPVGITDISPGQPAGDIQVVDRRNIIVDANTGKTVKVVPVTAKIQRRRRSRGRGGISMHRFQMELERIRSDNQQQNMMMMLLSRR